MKYNTILLEKDSGVAIVTLNQPEKFNLITNEMFDDLMVAFRDVASDNAVRVVVLTAAGDIFSAGVDLREHFLDPIEKAKSGEINMALERSFSEVGVPAILNIKKPMIAAINGPAVGLGFTICLMFDIRIASEDAKISLAFWRVGIAPEFGSTYFLPRLIGISKALELLYTGQAVSAQEAKEIGLVNRVVPAKSLKEVTLEVAKKLAERPPIAIQLTREGIYQGANADIEAAVKWEHFAYNVCRQTEDHEEAVRAFLEKRSPSFKGK
ncbi:enoyl-CoA hydratase/isomerase family protein [Chloroflexota bacterium]